MTIQSIQYIQLKTNPCASINRKLLEWLYIHNLAGKDVDKVWRARLIHIYIHLEFEFANFQYYTYTYIDIHY